MTADLNNKATYANSIASIFDTMHVRYWICSILYMIQSIAGSFRFVCGCRIEINFKLKNSPQSASYFIDQKIKLEFVSDEPEST